LSFEISRPLLDLERLLSSVLRPNHATIRFLKHRCSPDLIRQKSLFCYSEKVGFLANRPKLQVLESGKAGSGVLLIMTTLLGSCGTLISLALLAWYE